MRDEAGSLEDELDDQARDRHRGVEGCEQEPHHLPAVVAPVDVEDRQDDQVGEDERKYAAEGDAAVPKDSSERDVADRADEAEDGDERPDHWSPELGEGRVSMEEERLPPRVG